MSKPLIIYNHGLGYKITYFLDKFEFYKKTKSFLYSGSAFFNDDLSSEITQKTTLEKRRRYAYLGSRTHFFISLWKNELKSNGFIIRNSSSETLDYIDIVVEIDSLKKYLISNNLLKLYYLSKTPVGYLEFLKDTVAFDGSGYFDGSGVKILGQMAKTRIR